MHVNTSIGGERRYVLAPAGEKIDMRVPDEVRQCTVFLAAQVSSNRAHRKFIGTAFIVSVPFQDPLAEKALLYLVTARHVIEAAEGENIWVRANMQDGSSNMVETKKSLWLTHPTDNSVDVAVLPFNFQGPLLAKYVPVSMLLTGEITKEKKIGTGDEVFLTGLFAQLQGSERNLPIVRLGNIAMMPDERVPTSMGPIEAYLIEARSIGGLSGSPVFVRETLVGVLGSVYLLGLMHGHWDIPPENKNDTIDATGNNNAVNMGIAIVVPAEKIREVIDRKELVDMRKNVYEKELKKRWPTPDAVQQEGITKKEFEEILERATRPLLSKSDEGESKT